MVRDKNVRVKSANWGAPQRARRAQRGAGCWGVGERFTAEIAEGAEGGRFTTEITESTEGEKEGDSCIGGVALRSFDKLRRARFRANRGLFGDTILDSLLRFAAFGISDVGCHPHHQSWERQEGRFANRPYGRLAGGYFQRNGRLGVVQGSSVQAVPGADGVFWEHPLRFLAALGMTGSSVCCAKVSLAATLRRITRPRRRVPG